MISKHVWAALVLASVIGCSDDTKSNKSNNTSTNNATNNTADAGGDAADAASDATATNNTVDMAPACVPTEELCNGVDDDCDLRVDEGCPDEEAVVTFSGNEALWTLGIAGGQTLNCGPNAATMGMVVANDSTYVRGIRAQCATARVEKSLPEGAQEYTYKLVFSPSSVLPDIGFAGNDAAIVQDFHCGGAVYNGEGAAAPGSYAATTVITKSTNLLGGVLHGCATFSVVRNEEGEWVAKRDDGAFRTQWTSHDPNWAESFYDCQGDQVANGYAINFAGADVNGLTMICADISVPVTEGIGIDPNRENDCTDGLDDDEDSLVDCQDPDCADVACGLYGQTCMNFLCQCADAGAETSCDDGEDNDCDGLVDCQDSDCGARTCGSNGRQCEDKVCVCASGVSEQCNNGTDDNCDGLADCADPSCNAQICDNSGGTCNGGQCACTPKTEICNGVDDDCDGVADDGCPDTTRPLEYGGSEAWLGARGTIGNIEVAISCGSTHAATGLWYKSHDIVDQVAMQCHHMFLRPRMNGNEYVYDVYLGPRSDTPTIGVPENGSVAGETVCWSDGTFMNGLNTIYGNQIDSFAADCYRGTLERNGSGNWQFLTSFNRTANYSFRYPTGIPNQAKDTCPAGMAVNGAKVWYNENIDAMQLRCNTVSWHYTQTF